MVFAHTYTELPNCIEMFIGKALQSAGTAIP